MPDSVSTEPAQLRYSVLVQWLAGGDPCNWHTHVYPKLQGRTLGTSEGLHSP